jgi:hypothetical protein
MADSFRTILIIIAICFAYDYMSRAISAESPRVADGPPTSKMPSDLNKEMEDEIKHKEDILDDDDVDGFGNSPPKRGRVIDLEEDPLSFDENDDEEDESYRIVQEEKKKKKRNGHHASEYKTVTILYW